MQSVNSYCKIEVSAVEHSNGDFVDFVLIDEYADMTLLELER